MVTPKDDVTNDSGVVDANTNIATDSPITVPSAAHTSTAACLQIHERAKTRSEIGLSAQKSIPFMGADIWNAYEFSWLDRLGKPHIALVRWVVPSQCLYTVDAKSVQSYLNGFAMQSFANSEAVHAQLTSDLSAVLGMSIAVSLILPDAFEYEALCPEFDGVSLDRLLTSINTYENPHAQMLQVSTNQQPHEEVLVSNLLCSQCPQDEMPLWASIRIAYTGASIDHAALLHYLVSYRLERISSQACIERIYMDILRQCQPQRLHVYGRYTRRYGVDVNIVRCSAPEKQPSMQRLIRQ